MCVCVVSSQKCATVNRLRGREVTLPLPLAGSINSDTQRNAVQRSTYFLLCMFVCVYEHILHVTAHISKAKKKTSAIKRCRGCREQPQGPLRAALLGLGASGCPLGARGALTLQSFFPDTNQTQQQKHIQGWGCVLCVCIYERKRETKRQTSRGREMEGEGKKKGDINT